MCFSPKKHKGNVISRVESGLPCKLTRFSFHKKEDNVNWVNTATQINDALEATVDFCREANDNKTPVANTKNVDNIQVYQGITVTGIVLFGDNKAEPVSNKTDLIKKEGSFVHEFGTMPMTIWNKQIETVEEGLLHISQQKIKDAKLKANKITCDNIQSVDITVFYNCVTCSKKVQFQQGSPMLRCMNWRSRFLIKNSTKTTTTRISIKKTAQTIWYSLFTSTIEAIIKKYNKDNNELETIEEIDEDKLCQVILTMTGIKRLSQ